MLQNSLRTSSTRTITSNENCRLNRYSESSVCDTKPLISERNSSPQSNEMTKYESRLKALEKYDLKNLIYKVSELERRLFNLEKQLGDKIAVQKYTPFFMNESHVGINNSTTLNGNNLEIVIDILNYTQSELDPLIYPFGNTKLSTNYKIMALDLKYVDEEDDGVITGILKKNKEGIYVIELVNFQNTFAFPMNITCNVLLKCD